MKTKLLLSVAALTFVVAGQTHAQLPNFWHINIQGTSSTTNRLGQIVPQPVNNATLLRHIANVNGTTDYSGWALAYHIGGNDLGDTIDIINRTNGTVLQTLFGLYFGQAFERKALVSGNGRQSKRIEYIYTDQSPHSIGSVLLSDYFYFDKNGNTNWVTIVGQMQWLVMPDAKNPTMRVNSGRFRTTTPYRF